MAADSLGMPEAAAISKSDARAGRDASFVADGKIIQSFDTPLLSEPRASSRFV